MKNENINQVALLEMGKELTKLVTHSSQMNKNMKELNDRVVRLENLTKAQEKSIIKLNAQVHELRSV